MIIISEAEYFRSSVIPKRKVELFAFDERAFFCLESWGNGSGESEAFGDLLDEERKSLEPGKRKC